MTTTAMTMDTRKIKHIGCWNVRTMYEISKSHQVAEEMERNNITILALSEIRWKGVGKTKLQNGKTVIYSGKTQEEDRHESGVAFMLGKEATMALIEWEGISDRIITARFKARFKNLSIINAYAPTNEAEQITKEEFYAQLQSTYDKLQNTHKKDMLIVMGDMNAKIGSCNTGRETVMGKEALGVINENGEMFADFCAQNSLMIGGSMFPHKRIHKETWTSPDGQTKNQIDHITIDKKWRHSLLDVRAMRGADVGSDHMLVRGKIKIKLASIKKPSMEKRERYNVQWLKDGSECAEEYRTKLREVANTIPNPEESTIEELWERYKCMYKQTAKEVIGIQKRTNKPWLSQETWKKIEQRRQIKHKIIEKEQEDKERLKREYKEKDKEIKRSARRDRREYQEDLLVEAETAARQNDLRTLYKTTKKLSETGTTSTVHVKNKEGKILKNEKEIIARWLEYFREVYAKKEIEQELEEEEISEELNLSITEFTHEEINNAIKQLKGGKAAGIDNITAELLKADRETSTNILYILINKIWKEEKVPDEWKKGIIVKIPKKGDHTKCENWRAITLLNVTSKVMTKIMLERMKGEIDRILRPNQAGFRGNKACTDHISTLRIILEQTLEWQNKIYINFIDFKQAFDRVDRERMWDILRRYGLPSKYIRVIKIFYENYTAQIMHNGQLTEPINIDSGVRQGCILSPTIFLILVDWIMKKTTRNKTGIRWNAFSQLEDLEFADDVCLISEKRQHMQKKTEKLSKEAKKIGLSINTKKTKIIKINTEREMGIFVEEEEIESVQKFCYLGSILDKNGRIEEEVNARINKAQNAFYMLRKIWGSNELTLATKIRIFNTNVKSILLYASETWKTEKRVIKKTQTFINKCLRKILKIYWPNRITNKELWEKTKQEPVAITINRRKWKFIGHTLRKDGNDITKQALDYQPTGRRRVGRPAESWKRSTTKEIEMKEITWGEVKAVAKNREEWRKFVEALCSDRSQED